MSPSAGIPMEPKAAICSSYVEKELFVTNTTRMPASRNEAIALTEPGIG